MDFRPEMLISMRLCHLNQLALDKVRTPHFVSQAGVLHLNAPRFVSQAGLLHLTFV